MKNQTYCKNVAFIPVRGGSKNIALKNIKQFCGYPLVYRVLEASCKCRFIDEVYVSTDSDIIAGVVEKFDGCNSAKIKIIGRSAETAVDTASTESAMLEFAERYEFDNIVLIQATSPLLSSEDLDNGFLKYREKNVDSVLSVVRQRRFCWAYGRDGFVSPLNYDVYNRPMRQNFDGYIVENGAFYITSREKLFESGNRISGNIAAVEMSGESYHEIDNPEDWIVMETLMRNKTVQKMNGFSSVKMFITDCDGCLTDCGMYYSETGDELKKFNTRDGMGFSLLREAGIITGVITGENVELNRRRFEKLHLDVYVPGCKDKLAALKQVCTQYNVNLCDVCYVGDDINDIDCIKAVGFGCCPSNAMSKVKDVADYVAELRGGEGVVREIADIILDSRSQKKGLL